MAWYRRFWCVTDFSIYTSTYTAQTCTIDQSDVIFGASSSHRVAGDIFVWRRPTKAARIHVAPTGGMQSAPNRALDPTTHQQPDAVSQKLTAPRPKHLAPAFPSIPLSGRPISALKRNNGKHSSTVASAYFILLHVVVVVLVGFAVGAYFPDSIVSQYVLGSMPAPSLLMSSAVGSPSGGKDTDDDDDVFKDTNVYDFVII